MKVRPARYTARRFVVFLAILVGLALVYTGLNELVIDLGIRKAAQDLIGRALNARVSRIRRVGLSREGALELHGVRVDVAGFEEPFYTAESVDFLLEEGLGRIAEKGFHALKEVKLRRVDLRRPRLYFVKSPEGGWNVDRAFTRSPSRGGAAGGSGAEEPPRDYFPREGIFVHQGSIHVVFHREKGPAVHWVVDDLDFKITKSPGGRLRLSGFDDRPILKGTFSGGQLTIDLELFDYRKVLEGKLQVRLVDADLGVVTRGMKLERPIRGRLTGMVSLERSLRETKGRLRGSGYFQVAEGDLYDYPMVAAALSILSFTAPKGNKITEAYGRFTLEEDHIVVEQLDFIGTSLSLFGSGECGLNGEELYVCLAPRLPGTLNPLNFLVNTMGTVLLEGSVTDPKGRYTPLAAIQPAFRRYIERELK